MYLFTCLAIYMLCVKKYFAQNIIFENTIFVANKFFKTLI